METIQQSQSRSEKVPVSVPSLALNDIALSLAASGPQISVPGIPAISRLALPSKSSKGKSRRPSTASSAEEKCTLLPTSSNFIEQSTPLTTPSVGSSDGDRVSLLDQERPRSMPTGRASIEEVNKRAHEAVAGLRAEASRLSGAAEVHPSPFDPSPTDEQLSQSMSVQENFDDQVDYDWATFINAYALGRWDPLKTPQPPRSHLQPPFIGQTSRSMLYTAGLEVASGSGLLTDSPVADSAEEWVEDETYEAPAIPSGFEDVVIPGIDMDAYTHSAPPLFHIPSAVQSSSAPHPTSVLPDMSISKLSDRRTRMSLHLGPLTHRLRNSFADLRSSSGPGSNQPDSSKSSNVANTDITTSVAAIRWAAARVSVAPLALPSPEHELTDPMRGVTATIPGSHPPEYVSHPEPLPISPNGMRKTRLSSFWQGTQDVEDTRLPTIEASPPEPEPELPNALQQGRKSPPIPISFVGAALPPATAPVRVSTAVEEDDYFGRADGTKMDSGTTSNRPSFSAGSSGNSVLLELDSMRQSSAPPFEHDPATVPALPRRICLTRQTSAPLPMLAIYERRMRSSRPASDGSVTTLVGRAAKEEQMFCELGYLAPPNPPDELERRRALYKFNIWNTGHDMNFDRIAHLVKLVFSTRIVAIALVDGTEVFFKSGSGLSSQNLPRTCSFDAHALLQRDDEPIVVLDAQDDWRFAKNPLVTGAPHIRFYAGCPLRTQDGFNIGTLSIIDDTPRREFSPRQRHTLKEFAQIAIREMELWRDKIQLRIRDRIQSSMEQFTRECLEVDKDPDGESGQALFGASSMEQIYERAAKLVKRTLDVEGAIVMDVSHVDVLETVGAESLTSITLHTTDPQSGTSSKTLCAEEHAKLQEFFAKYPDGKISEGIVPAALRPFLPTRIQYALSVPIFNVDKRPFAVLCAYSTGERTTPFLEGHELSYLRAIGVIILSAVLKRRMILADKAKSLFISNISHELRTPLHGILASAELLSETQLDHSQASFLQTVQACGTSLVETVNHVLDFTKLSGNAKAGGVENSIHHSRVDLMQLVEEATEGCWIGHRARMFTSEIGSVYSPPKSDRQIPLGKPTLPRRVETVIDIGHNDRGWTLKCEKGGIRRVLMNLFGNSLKFTSDGFVHVMLRQLPPANDQPENIVKIELSVIDTGKGISQNFLKHQLFHPFSQENPFQTGTGLGLAIVNSIVRSSSVNGKVDVWSAEGVGTEIKVTFTAETVENEDFSSCDAELVKIYNSLKRPAISLEGFSEPHRGVQLLRDVTMSYLVSRWGLDVAENSQLGDIVIVNEDAMPVSTALHEKDIRRPFIILSSARGDPRLMSTSTDFERIGGYCRIAYKPVGPYRMFTILKQCLHFLNITEASRLKSSLHAHSPELDGVSEGTSRNLEVRTSSPSGLSRRYSGENGTGHTAPVRPSLGPRAMTAHPTTAWVHMSSTEEASEAFEPDYTSDSGLLPQSPSSPTIAVGTGGTLLKSSVGTGGSKELLRVLVVEDNSILRNLLVKWLKNKGFDHREAADGVDGVRVFDNDGNFDVVLLDLSMPLLDGIGATARIRQIEAKRQQALHQDKKAEARVARILALTGMSSLEDKRRAFEAGVDGYLVKPVAFKTLDSMFHKLGFS